MYPDVSDPQHNLGAYATACGLAATGVCALFVADVPGQAILVVTIVVLAIGGHVLNRALARSHDVTDAQAVEIVMQQRLEHVAALAPGVICTLALGRDLMPAVTYAGPGLDALLGASRGPGTFRSDLLGARVDVRDLAVTRSSFGAAVSEHGPWQHEFRITHPGLGTRWIAVSAAYDGSSMAGARWQAVLEDVTERHLAPHLRRSGDLAHGTVLIYEDEPGIRVLLERLLLEHGYEVLAAVDPDQALRIAGDGMQPVDLLVSSRPELVNRLSAHYGSLPTLLLEKPFDDADLLREVRRLLDR
jgi:hypothetical protein